MTCTEAEKMVVPYIEDKLSLSELEEFMEHIETCENCREELETYDIAGDLKRKLTESRRVLKSLLMFRITRYAVRTLMAMSLIVTVLLQLRIWHQAGFLFF